MRDCTILDLWLDTARSLTIMQAARALAQLHQGYSQHYVHAILGARHIRGSFAFLAAYTSSLRNWYNIRCKFMGGPKGKTEVAGTLGMFVADCFMREVAAGRENLVWDAYYEVNMRGSDE